ncbi:MAG: hypothetical protein JWQ71_3177 [Pedosphaera sp.]|nr:hypothetical protein [Pedosphaera sp.]
MKANSKKILGAVLLVAASLQFHASGQVLFSDDFQANTSASWSIFGNSANGATTDYSAQFAFDYGTQTYSLNGTTNTVPPAPNSGGTTKGLKVTVNKNGNTSAAGVSLYPTGKVFTNNYALKFDLWMDYNGDVAFGGSGSTEFATFGLDHLGTEVNWSSSTISGDGIWFATDADAGTGRDYRAYVGDPASNLELTSVTGGFFDREGNGTIDQNAPDDGSFSGYQLMFRSPPFQTPGGIGKRWVQVEVRQQDGVVSWLMDGYLMASHSNNNGFTSGNIMLGYMDPFTEIASPANENYAIFDNVRVVDLTSNTPLPTIDIVALDSDASEPGANTGFVTITRSGSTTSALVVNLIITGTASNGVDYVTIPSTVTFLAGAASTNITITPINDSIGEPTETAIIAIAANASVYEVRTNVAIVNIADDGDLPILTLATTRAIAYENFRVGKFTAKFSNPNSTDTIIHYTLTGTATNGVDYVTLPGTATILSGQTNVLITVSPINNTKLDGNRTVIMTLTSGAGYALGATTNGTVTIRDDDLAPGTLLFSDNFDSAASASSWAVFKSDPANTLTFGYDYGADGIPSAPNSVGGTTKGLKFEALAATASGMSVSPIGQSFTGDYRLRFDMWINYNGPLDVGGNDSTECFDAGIGTSGNHVNWDAGDSTIDGIWFAITGDGGYGDDYQVWINQNEQSVASGVYTGGSQNNNAAYYAEFGGDAAPQIQQDNYPNDQTLVTLPGNGGFAWHDVVITKQGTNVIWSIDGLQIAKVNSTAFTLSTNIFLGYMDDSSTAAPIPALSFGLADNVRVEALNLPKPQITSIKVIGVSVQIDFSGVATDTTASFTIQSSTTIAGTFADVSPVATITQLSPGSFRATTPVNGNVRFFRVRR